jgi:hypothetical protein
VPGQGDILSGELVEIVFDGLKVSDEAGVDVRLMLQWSPAEKVLRKWARFRLRGRTSIGILQEVVLEQLDTQGNAGEQKARPFEPGIITIRRSRNVMSYPVFVDGFFMGIEFPVSTVRTGKGQIILGYCPGLQMEAGVWYETRKAVYGVAGPGRERQAFQEYLGAHRPLSTRAHINYNSWWTSPVPYSEADILKLMEILDERLYQPYGVRFDSFCIDMGWSDEKSVWAISKKLFPEGFDRIRKAAARMKCNLGLWISPSDIYSGRPGAMDGDWAQLHGYETFLSEFRGWWLKGGRVRGSCVGGKRYGRALRDRLVEMVTHNGVRQIKFDGYFFRCPSSDHGHGPGDFSADVCAEGLISVFRAIHQAVPEVWIEATCFGWNPSPWWLFYVNSAIGAYGQDSPYGRVPAPVYRESYTTARDYYNLQGTALTCCPINSQEVLGIIHQSPEPFGNDAVMTIMRGHMFLPAYINPEYMSEDRWRKFAGLVKWFRRNSDVLSETQALLPKSWSAGKVPKLNVDARMPREAYGYAHWKGNRSLVVIRNPWIEPQTFELKVDGISSKAVQAKTLSAVSLYPQVRLYGRDLKVGGRLTVPLAPYETVVLSVGPDQTLRGLQPVGEVIRNRIRATDVKHSIDGVRFDLKAEVEVDAPLAELLILLESSKPVADSQRCSIFIDGKETTYTSINSEDGWSASHRTKAEHWLFLKVPLGKKQDIRLELVASREVSDISTWVWAKSRFQTGLAEYPNRLPVPEVISLDGQCLAAVEVLHKTRK